jgi:glutaminase
LHADAVTALCWAASVLGRQPGFGIQTLIARGIDTNLADYDGRTALHLAASEGHVHVIEVLLAMRAEFNPIDRWGNSPLDDAKRGGHTAVITALEAHGGGRGTPPERPSARADLKHDHAGV